MFEQVARFSRTTQFLVTTKNDQISGAETRDTAEGGTDIPDKPLSHYRLHLFAVGATLSGGVKECKRSLRRCYKYTSATLGTNTVHGECWHRW